MSHHTFYAMPTDAKANAAKGTSGNTDYYDPTEADLIAVAFRSYTTDRVTVKIVSDHDGSSVNVGDTVTWITDTGLGHRRSNVTGRVVAVRHADGSTEGTLPTRALTLHVMK